jgi:hypothetical protein
MIESQLLGDRVFLTIDIDGDIWLRQGKDLVRLKPPVFAELIAQIADLNPEGAE